MKNCIPHPSLFAVAVAALALVPAAALAAPPTPVPDPKPWPNPVHLPPPPPPTPVVVSVGDSAISGEAGRWAGNTKIVAPPIADALGPHAYDDNAGGTGEATPGCHRSKSAEVHIGVAANGSTVNSVNLACSGSKTDSYAEGSTGNFKPGLDFRDAGGQKGQAQLLKEYALSHPKGSIKAVAVLNGANEFGFADIAGTCAKHFVETPYIWKNLCSDDPDLFMRFGAANFNAIVIRLVIGFLNVHSAMASAGYQDGDYKIIAQTYASETPPASLLRYPEFGYARSAIGGCPLWNADADWIDSTVVEDFNRAIRSAVANVTSASYSPRITNVEVLDARNAFVGHRLCEAGVGMLEEAHVGSWQQPDAADRTEWVKQVNTFLPTSPDYQENAHPNYWGQMAMRNCFRQAYNNGSPRGGTCVRGGNSGLDSRGEPNMTLQ